MRLIDAEALENDTREKVGYLYGVTKFIKIINEQPTIEAKPIIHAHWEKHLEHQDDHFACWFYSCSNCNELLYSSLEHSKYCSHCGAQMDEPISQSYENGVKIPVISMEDVPKIMEEKE